MAKKAITWTELLALDPCEAGLEAALAAFPDWPSEPPTWAETMAKEENNGYRRWLISRVLPPARAVEWARLCADSVAHLQSIAAAEAAYWATEAAYWADRAAYWADRADRAAYWAAYWATGATGAAKAARAEYAVSSVPSVYALALPFLEAM